MLGASDLTCPCVNCRAMLPSQRKQPVAQLVTLLRIVEDELPEYYPHVPAKLKITSGVRCAAHNALLGGAPDSEHIDGKAVDIEAADSMLRFALVEMLIIHGGKFIEICPRHIHVDLRDGPQRLILGDDK